MIYQKLFLILFFLISIFFSPSDSSFAADEENCILCHKHEKLRILDEDGEIKSFHVDNEDFKHSIHTRVRCRGCHTQITEVPHKSAYKKVNCGITCHLKKGLSVGSFSHSRIYDSFMTSAHGSVTEDTPDCLYCHPINEMKQENDPKQKKNKRNKKSRLEILALCSSCHSDDDKMSGYDIAPGIVGSYKRSHHARTFFLDEKSGVICSDCHSIHNIAASESDGSPVNAENLMSTCAGQEASLKGCHIVSNPEFILTFDHEKNKEAGILTALKFDNFINYLVLLVFYFFCALNILKIIRS